MSFSPSSSPDDDAIDIEIYSDTPLRNQYDSKSYSDWNASCIEPSTKRANKSIFSYHSRSVYLSEDCDNTAPRYFVHDATMDKEYDVDV